MHIHQKLHQFSSTDKKFEVIWLKLCPLQLPKGLSCIIIANVYHPQTNKRLRHAELPLQLHVGHWISFPNCGILIANNFNRLDMSCFCNAFQLKQIVKFWMGSNWSSPTWPHLHQNEGLLQDPHQTPYLRPLRPCHQWDPSPTLTAQTKDLAICVPLYTPKQKNWTWSLPL